MKEWLGWVVCGWCALLSASLLGESLPTTSPQVNSEIASPSSGVFNTSRLLGTWTTQYPQSDGSKITEYTTFRPDGVMTIDLIDGAGKPVRHVEGTYVLLSEDSLSFATEGQSYVVSLRWINDSQLELLNGSNPTPYVRVQGDSPPSAGHTSTPPAATTTPLTHEERTVGTGTILVYRQENVTSAKQMLSLALHDASQRLGSRPTLLDNGIIADRKDLFIQAWFIAKGQNGTRQGLAMASIEGNQGQAVVLYDDDTHSLVPLFDALKKSSPKTPPSVVWESVPLPDNSGTLRLPRGWQIVSANKGMVEAKGEQGGVAFGLYVPVVTPEAVQLFLQQSGVPASMVNLVSASYSNPQTALQDLFPQFSKIAEQSGGEPMRLVRFMDNIPIQGTPNSQAAYLYYEWESGRPGTIQKYQTLAMVIIAPLSTDQWFFYASSVTAPSATFLRDLPVLIEIWKSWKVADWVHTERLMQAIRSHQEAFEIQQSAYAYKSYTFDKVMKAWGEYNRGEHAVLDQSQGMVYKTQLLHVDQVVQDLNAQEGYERYIKINPFDLDY